MRRRLACLRCGGRRPATRQGSLALLIIALPPLPRRAGCMAALEAERFLEGEESEAHTANGKA
jgi:hypothetical protein